MNVAFENVNTEALDMERVAQGVARIAQQAPLPDSITVVFTGDFEGSITARSSSMPTYTAERLGGVGLATAMTLPGEGSECTIVASAALFVSGADIETLGGVRLLAHEGWHAAMHQREEETNDIRFRLGLGDGTDGFFYAMAGVAIGEYRVERSLCNEGWWPVEAYIGTLGEVLTVLEEEHRIALQPGDDFPDRAWEFITGSPPTPDPLGVRGRSGAGVPRDSDANADHAIDDLAKPGRRFLGVAAEEFERCAPGRRAR